MQEQVVLIKMIINTLIKTLIIQQKAPEEVPTPEASSNSAADMMFALVRIKLHFFFFKFFSNHEIVENVSSEPMFNSCANKFHDGAKGL